MNQDILSVSSLPYLGLMAVAVLALLVLYLRRQRSAYHGGRRERLLDGALRETYSCLKDISAALSDGDACAIPASLPRAAVDPDARARILDLHARGVPVQRISRELGIAPPEIALLLKVQTLVTGNRPADCRSTNSEPLIVNS